MRDTARLQICHILWKAECLHAAGNKSKPKPSLRDNEKKASFLWTETGLHGVFQSRKTLKNFWIRKQDERSDPQYIGNS